MVSTQRTFWLSTGLGNYPNSLQQPVGYKLANILNFGFHIATSLLHKFQQSHLQ
jgi:hypothetical protein